MLRSRHGLDIDTRQCHGNGAVQCCVPWEGEEEEGEEEEEGALSAAPAGC